jgi:hypothetical protein
MAFYAKKSFETELNNLKMSVGSCLARVIFRNCGIPVVVNSTLSEPIPALKYNAKKKILEYNFDENVMTCERCGKEVVVRKSYSDLVVFCERPRKK